MGYYYYTVQDYRVAFAHTGSEIAPSTGKRGTTPHPPQTNILVVLVLYSI